MLVQIKEIMQLRKGLLSGFLSGSTLKHESAEFTSLVERDHRHPSPGLNAPSLSEIEVMLRNL